MPKRRERAGLLEYSRKLWLRAWLAATFLFLYFPILSLIAFSFNNSKRNITWQGFTFDYYIRRPSTTTRCTRRSSKTR